nr:RNA-directed DNA polymerase, eukaryota [Tanacetum cinerariifolium]
TCEDVSNVKPSNVPQDNLPEQAFIPSRDLFGIDDLIFKPSKVHKADIPEKVNTKPEFPPSFTPLNSNHEATVSKHVTNNNPSVQSPKEASNNVFDEGITATKPDNTSYSGSMHDHNDSIVCGSNPANGFSILEHFQEFITISQTMGYGMKGCKKYYSTWMATNSDLLFISVYSPQELTLKRVLWVYMADDISRWHGEVVVMRDFNEFRVGLPDDLLNRTKIVRYF